MAPGYRANNQSRRQNRGIVDHDIFEGLPVRNWRRDVVIVAPPPAHDASGNQKDKWDVELPWGMPKDAHLMPQHSQDLLRAARSGRLYVKRPLIEDEETEADILLADKPEKKEIDPKEEGFSVKTWKLVPKHLEGPEIDYLAKRRKGLRGSVIKGTAPPAATLTKTTVRRTDEQGNSYVEDVVLAEGQTVEGEVISQTVIPAAAAMGADGIPLQATPQKRRPPPPKRKAKGPGRGRKKKVPLPPTSVPTDATAPVAAGQPQEAPNAEPTVGPDGVKVEQAPAAPAENEDIEMGEGSAAASDDEGSDGDDGSEDDDQDDEGEGSKDGENDGGNENDNEPTPLDNKPQPPPAGVSALSLSQGSSEIQDLPQYPLESTIPHLPQGSSHGKGGSPLKNAFTPPVFSPAISTQLSEIESGHEEADGDLDDTQMGMEDEQQSHEHQLQQQHELQYHDEGQPHDQHHTHDESFAHDHNDQHQFGHVQQPGQEFMGMEDHDMPPPQDSSHHPDTYNPSFDNSADFQGLLENTPPAFDSSMSMPHDDEMLLDHDHLDLGDDFDPNMPSESEQVPMESEPEPVDQAEHMMDDGDQGFEDLLGSLEDHLNDHSAALEEELPAAQETPQVPEPHVSPPAAEAEPVESATAEPAAEPAIEPPAAPEEIAPASPIPVVQESAPENVPADASAAAEAQVVATSVPEPVAAPVVAADADEVVEAEIEDVSMPKELEGEPVAKPEEATEEVEATPVEEGKDLGEAVEAAAAAAET